MDIIRKLIRSSLDQGVRENLELVFGQLAELIVLVLQFQLCQLHLVDDFFTHLRVDWNPFDAGFLFDLSFGLILLRNETFLVHVDENELTGKPCFDFLVSFANAIELRLIAFPKHEGKLARLRGVVVALDGNLVDVNALQGLPVVLQITH